jgi:hypothetical protein
MLFRSNGIIVNDNNFKPIEYSRAYSEALWVAIETTRSEAYQLRTSLESDEKCKGSVAVVIENKMIECFEAADLLEGQLKRHGHRDFLKRMREADNPIFRVA